MAKLTIERGPEKGQERECTVGENIFIGRGKDLPFVISDQMASRRHCVVTHHKGKWIIKDLASGNGTFVNGKQMGESKAQVLKHGDVIQIGETLLVFQDTALETDPLYGKVLGGYRIDERLGRGAMGVVYRAHQLSLGRDIALKILSADIAHDTRFSEMFVKEARAVAALNNPNILQVYDVGKDGEFLFISMEIASGGSVLEELRRAGTLSLERSVRIVKDTLNALAYAEKRGIVHRDIKPDNLMIGADDEIKLGDLGLAASTAELTGEEGGVFGTPHYIAPEQAQGKAIDHRADIYALGATWYRLLSGQTLFGGTNVREILRNQVRTPHRPLIQVMPEIPMAISNIIDRMLAKDPDERYQSANDVRDDIELWEGNRGISGAAIAASLDSRKKPIFVTGVDSKKKLLVAGGLFLALLAGAAFFVFSGETKPDPNPQSNAPVAGPNPNNDNNAPRDPDEVLSLLAEAKALLALSGAEARLNGETKLRDLIALWPESLSAKEAQTRLYDLEEEDRISSLNVKNYMEGWAKLRARVRGELAESYKVANIDEALNTFRGSLLADTDHNVNALAESLNFAELRAEGVGKLDNYFRLSMANIQNTTRGNVPIEALDGAIEDIRALSDETDQAALKELAANALKSLQAAHDKLKEANDAREKERLRAALRRTEAAFDATLGEIENAVRSLNFAQAAQTLTDFESNNADYKTDHANPFFALLRASIADRQQQTEEAHQAAVWLFRNWESDPGADAKANVKLGPESPLRAYFYEQYKAESIGFIKPFANLPDFTLVILLDARRREFAPAEVKAMPVAALAELLQIGSHLEATLEGIDEDKSQTLRVGVGALLLEFGLAEAAFQYIHQAYQLSQSAQNALTKEQQRRIREYMGWAYLARAKEANDRGAFDDAEVYLETLRSDFGDTRAARP